MKHIVLIFILNAFLFANSCNNRSFSLNTKIGESITIKDIVSSLSDECQLSVHFKDDLVEKKLDKKLFLLKIKDFPFKEFLDYVFTKNNIFYSIENNILDLAFIKTKTFKVDYVSTQIQGQTSFSASMNPDQADTGNTLNSTFTFDFWKDFETNIQSIINTSEDSNTFTATTPIIDRNSGLVTITATKKQLDRVQNYINELNKRIHKEVVIDVRIYSVTLSKSHSTGINWSEFSFSLNNGTYNEATQTYGASSTAVSAANIIGSNSIFKSSKFNVNGLLNFLSQNGQVNSISNPKVTTLNNQKAIINIGQVKNFTFNEVTTDANGNQSTSETVGSKFIGILLDITPQISDDNVIMMRINPSISDLDSSSESKIPDTIEKKLNTIIRVGDNDTLILGGLITDEKSFHSGGIPILKEIPIIKYMFGYKEEITSRRELVFVITPHIIDPKKKRKLKDLNYKMPSLGEFN
jgi:general secretion pathway protein D